jgi:voltage-dependent potassium channel beta subunit
MDMPYNRLGRAGVRVSALSFGSWVTFGKQLDLSAARKLMRAAFERGVNLFDNAEAYASGEAETLMGKALKDYRREDIVLSTKVFWGGKGPNDTGLSYKHVVEGARNSLARLGVDYVDLFFCHRPDPNTPVEETVRAMDYLMRSGRVFYWGTSEWSADQIEAAHVAARDIGCAPPAMEQPQYNLLHRARVEREYEPLFERYGMGTTIWSPLASGLLSGKYDAGIPPGSRFEKIDWLRETRNEANLGKVRRVGQLARELGCTPAQLAIAWCLKSPRVSSAILGATSLGQLNENLGALDALERLTPEVMARLDAIAPVAEAA